MSTQSDFAYDVFISYCQDDQDWVIDELLRRLEAGGLKVCLDIRDFELGVPKVVAMERALVSSRRTLLVLTPAYLESPWAEFEALILQTLDPANRRRRLIPVRKEQCQLPPRYAYLTSVDFTNPREQSSAWPRLLGALGPAALEPAPPHTSLLQPSRGLVLVGDQPEDFVPRLTLYQQIIAHLVGEWRSQPVVPPVALRGAGGYGKTTLARAICHDPEVQTVFRNGIHWLTLGQSAGDLTARVKDLIFAVSGTRPEITGVDIASAHLAQLLADKDILLVIDDVWNAADLRPFLVGGPRCARLITTRDSSTLPRNARQVIVEAMQQDEAVALLGAGLPAGAESVLHKLATRLGRWPLLLALANGALRERVLDGGQDLAGALNHINRALNKRGLTAFDAHDPRERAQAVELTIGVSLEQLSSDERVRYSELAIFPADAIPLATLERLWSVTGDYDDFDTDDLCARLGRLSLLQHYDPTRRVIRLHDVIRAYLEVQWRTALPVLHNQLLDVYRSQLRLDQIGVTGTAFAAHGAGWANLPATEPYLWRHLAHHLIGAGRSDELMVTIKDLRYLVRKTERCGSPAVEADLLAAEPYTSLIPRMIRRSSCCDELSPMPRTCWVAVLMFLR
jgi:hypothetical protein